MLMISFGTRQEYIKVKPIMDRMSEMGIGYKTFFTGQHKDLVKKKTDYVIEIDNGSNRLDSIVSSIMNSIDFVKEGITKVLVQGDTTSAMAVALTAFQNKIPVVHLEAGLRTYNLKQPYPEEANRQIISRIASIHLCPTELSKQNLINEKVAGKISVVGNTVLDNLKNIQTTAEKKVLVTMHRRENYNDIQKWFSEIDKLTEKYSDYEFILPIHPNPQIKKHGNIFKKVKVVEHFEYKKLIDYLSSCSYVVTYSGGIQEESAFLRKPCLVCRRETERTEGLNNFSLLCKEPEELFGMFEQLKTLKMSGSCPYGNGDSVKRIIEILENNK